MHFILIFDWPRMTTWIYVSLYKTCFQMLVELCMRATDFAVSLYVRLVHACGFVMHVQVCFVSNYSSSANDFPRILCSRILGIYCLVYFSYSYFAQCRAFLFAVVLIVFLTSVEAVASVCYVYFVGDF